VEIRARELELLSGKNDNQTVQEAELPLAAAEDDDVPF
jgi:hypothetical protein